MLKPGIRQRVRVGKGGLSSTRPVPVEYSEAVENWARERGGHARLKWMAHPMNCWAVILEYRIGDPRKGTNSDGEPVLLHDWKPAEWWAKHHPKRAKRHQRSNAIMPSAYAYDLDELGVSGIIERLDRGNILSGRGEFTSVQHAADETKKKNDALSDRRRKKAQDDAQHRALDMRRSLFKIPFLPVGIELSSRKEA